MYEKQLTVGLMCAIFYVNLTLILHMQFHLSPTLIFVAPKTIITVFGYQLISANNLNKAKIKSLITLLMHNIPELIEESQK